ncbi:MULTISPECIES: fumarylacetoacetate hydrolase family protein [Pseudoalteromonas]|uniref:fumarylacetoacetate hydrolase family protein n=1 Tax=Pseudoalteromonas TaxID=53246 RepID=UPI000FFECCAB|nr:MULTISPECIES: fumarylacetoacetate hydrolase family protein [Pseudoalteromonas]MCG9758342.1 fumarylacetoacetate hydrolase family protein [Pseudoalteromonas sp. Isolate6]NKC20187.1 fumarylacetoacetate hydrolase family protein [Pseudoalteromonas galatheae]RXE88394.1 fumarylacetoacetate hydrolase family protein [Pseudoalteromonas sp. A757]
MYMHQWQSEQCIDLPMGKVVCIGRNYVEHAKELDNPIPSSPLLFIKPATSLVPFGNEVTLNAALGEHHYEAELALLIGTKIDADTSEPLMHIAGVGLALDLTLRDLQSELKAQGHPWERAKAYDNSCPITPFVPCDENTFAKSIEYRFWQNGELKQHGDSSLMIFPITELLKEVSRYFTLQPGDIVLTGTPKGVGSLAQGDKLKLQLDQHPAWYSEVILK